MIVEDGKRAMPEVQCPDQVPRGNADYYELPAFVELEVQVSQWWTLISLIGRTIFSSHS